MSKHNTGGFAFPLPRWAVDAAISAIEDSGLSEKQKDVMLEEFSGRASGMTMRDYFAAKAMQALIDKYEGEDGSMYGIPESAYAYADAMLAAREEA